jgi:guanylate kinase
MEKYNYIGLGTPESFVKIKNYYGEDRVIPIYIEVEDGLRLQRALDRERSMEEPKYEEMCRRFLADQKDFCEENIIAAGISKRFYNNEMLQTCIEEVMQLVTKEI